MRVRSGRFVQKLVSVETDEIGYFYSDGRLNFFKTYDNKKYVVDYTMDEMEDMLDPEKYFRISRSFYVSIASVDQESMIISATVLSLR